MNSSEPKPKPSLMEKKSFQNRPSSNIHHHSKNGNLDRIALEIARRFNYSRPLGRGGSRAWRKRMMIYNRDEGICQLCREPVLLAYPKYHPRSLSMDHIRPKSKGGTATASNLQTSHYECNKSKGSRFTNEEQILPEDELYQVTRKSDNFCARMVVRNGKIIATTHVLRWARRHKLEGTIPYLEKHGYTVDRWEEGGFQSSWLS